MGVRKADIAASNAQTLGFQQSPAYPIYRAEFNTLLVADEGILVNSHGGLVGRIYKIRKHINFNMLHVIFRALPVRKKATKSSGYVIL